MTQLQPQLQQDTITIGKLDLCHFLLMNDSRYPCCILVPDRDNIKEIYEVSNDKQLMLWRESSYLAVGMMDAIPGLRHDNISGDDSKITAATGHHGERVK